jgi:hypothetical protein
MMKARLQETDKEAAEIEETELELRVCAKPDNWMCKIDTVDASIITSRSLPWNEREVTFIDESRRFNVTLTRATWLTFVVGHRDLLMSHTNWREFVKRAAMDEPPNGPESPSSMSHSHQNRYFNRMLAQVNHVIYRRPRTSSRS